MQIEPTELNKKAFLQIREDAEEGFPNKKRVIVQLLETGIQSGSVKSVILSDGYLKERAIPYKNIKNRLESQPVHNNSIIEVEVGLHKAYVDVFYVLDLKPIYVDSGYPVIGSPITYDDYQRNNHTFAWGASNTIPKLILNPHHINPKRESALTPISHLHDKIGRCTIRVRVIRCSAFNTEREKKKNHDLLLMDESGSIQMTLWREEVKRYYKIIEEGIVYLIENFKVTSESDFNQADSKWELKSNRKTKIIVAGLNDAEAVPQRNLNLMPVLRIINSAADKETVDVLGVVLEAPSSGHRTSSLGEDQFNLTEISLIDESNIKINVVGWKQNSPLQKVVGGQIVILESVNVKTYRNTKKLNFGKYSRLRTDIPQELPRIKKLTQWLRKRGRTVKKEFQRIPGDDLVIVPLKEIKKIAEKQLKEGIEWEKSFYAIVNIVGFHTRLTRLDPSQKRDRWCALIKICDHSEKMFVKAGDQPCDLILQKDPTDVGRLSRGETEQKDMLRMLLFERCFHEYLVSIRVKVVDDSGRKRVDYCMQKVYELYNTPCLREVNKSLLNTLSMLCSN